MDQDMSITIFSSVFYSGGSRPSDKGGGGGGSGGGVQKNFFRQFGPHFGRKIRAGRAPPLVPPLF